MVLGILVRLSPGNPVSPFLGAKVNTDVGHVSLPAFNLLAIAERGRIMRADSTTDIVVKQTGQEGCLHTVEIQTEIQV